ncbi:MAG: alpha/beta fold hydrolase [Gemmatimonadales bacterium]
MRRLAILLPAATLLGACGGTEELFRDHVVTPYAFVSAAGDTVQAERGQLAVPERRDDADSRWITLTYVRFPATTPTPGAPIVYLAGGPGGSGIQTARGRRFPLFMALRSVSDVIALDQRGTGESNQIPECTERRPIPDDQPASKAAAVEAIRELSRICYGQWREAGVDLAGYTTTENARDLDAVRAALGAEKVNLWGISYGTHLALAALKVMEPRIDRLVLASVEGLDQTVKLPARTDRYFERIQQAIDRDPASKALYPDAVGLIRRVFARLDSAPVRVTIPGEGGSTSFLMGGDEVRLFTAGVISDPDNLATLLRLFRSALDGDWTQLGGFEHRFMRRPIQISGMPELIDASSGIDAARRALVEEQARTSLLGDVLNFPIPHALPDLAVVDLGDDFRSPPVSGRPTLVLSGTLDGRTYPEAQREAVAKLGDVTFVTVAGAGHNLFMVSPAVGALIQRFLAGEAVSDTTIEVEVTGFRS